ncbi:MAG TPA: phage tail spike protein, partial [Thermaerobacter sp.]
MAQIMVLDRYEVVRAVLGDGPSACPILEDLHTEVLETAAITYEFAVPADHPDAQAIAGEGYVVIRDLDGNLQQFRIKVVEDKLDTGGKRVRRVTAENAALELNGSIVRPATWTGVTASQALQNALSGTRWQPGVVEWAGSRTIVIDGYKSVTEVLHQIASEFGLEIRWRVEW